MHFTRRVLMEHTKDNILKLLKAMEENAVKTSILLRESGDDEYADKKLRDSMAYQEIIWLFENEQYFDEIANIYGIK